MMLTLKCISLIFVVTGIIISVIGGIIGYYSFSVPTVKSRGSTGIFVGYKPQNSIGEVIFVLSLNPQNRTIDLTFWCTYFEKGNYSILMTLPYRIFSISQLIFPSPSGEWVWRNAESGSVVLVTFQAEEPENGYTKMLGITLHLIEGIAQPNYGVYNVDIPFGGTIPMDITEQIEQLPVTVPIIGDGAKGHIYLFIPSDAIITESTHPISRRNFVHNEFQSLEFHVERFEPMFIQYTRFEEVNRFQRDLFLSGLFLGIGIPTTISALFELFREKKYTK